MKDDSVDVRVVKETVSRSVVSQRMGSNPIPRSLLLFVDPVVSTQSSNRNSNKFIPAHLYRKIIRLWYMWYFVSRTVL